MFTKWNNFLQMSKDTTVRQFGFDKLCIFETGIDKKKTNWKYRKKSGVYLCR